MTKADTPTREEVEDFFGRNTEALAAYDAWCEDDPRYAEEVGLEWFEDIYCGCWDSFTDYCWEHAEDSGLFGEGAEGYFHIDAFMNDLDTEGYYTIEATGGRVYVFDPNRV